MSQHIVQSRYRGEPVSVLLGWDRPLQQFFLVIERTALDSQADEEDAEPFVYTNLEDPEVNPRNLAYFREVVARLAVPVPPQVFEAVAHDAQVNRGNHVVRYDFEGRAEIVYSESREPVHDRRH